MLLSKVTCIAFNIYLLSVHAFPGNQTCDHGIASDMLYCLSYRKYFPLFPLTSVNYEMYQTDTFEPTNCLLFPLCILNWHKIFEHWKSNTSSLMYKDKQCFNKDDCTPNHLANTCFLKYLMINGVTSFNRSLVVRTSCFATWKYFCQFEFTDICK